MPDTRWNLDGRRKSRLFDQRHIGDTRPAAQKAVIVETFKRVRQPILTLKEPNFAAGGGGTAGQPNTPPQPPTEALGPDRWHKRGRVYVYVSKDHISTSDDTPVNPGYAPLNGPSTINAAYAFARDVLVPKVQFASERVVLVIVGGLWNEALVINSNEVDIVGQGMPVLVGESSVDQLCNEVYIEGIEFYTEGDKDGAPAQVAMTVNRGLDIAHYPHGSIMFRDCRFRADKTAYVEWRRTDHENTEIIQDVQWDQTMEIASAISYIEPAARGYSIFRNSRISCFVGFDGLRGTVWNGFAFKATAKILPGGPDGGYAKGILHNDEFIMQTSGVLFENCSIYGSLLCEGSNVYHQGGAQFQGILMPAAHIHCYAVIRGWQVFDDNGAFNSIPGRVWFDHTKTHSGVIARFVPDPAQHTPYEIGGELWYLQSNHTKPFDGAAAASAFVDDASCTVNVLRSATPCTTFLPSSGVGNIVDCSVNVPGNMLDDWLAL